MGLRLRIARRIGVVALITFALDQASKIFVIHGLSLPEVGRIDVAPPYLVLTMAWNRGINFGIGAGADLRWVLIAVAVAVSAALALWVLVRAKRRVATGTGLVIGGALGNVLDRVQYGAVADFLNMSCCGIDNPFAFNVADTAIFLGAAVIALRA